MHRRMDLESTSKYTVLGEYCEAQSERGLFDDMSGLSERLALLEIVCFLLFPTPDQCASHCWELARGGRL